MPTVVCPTFSVDLLYCMPLGNALQILFGENYQSFLLTIQGNTVGIYCYGDGRFRIFNSAELDDLNQFSKAIF